VVEAGVDHECQVTEDEPRKVVLQKTTGNMSRKKSSYQTPGTHYVFYSAEHFQQEPLEDAISIRRDGQEA
jgi:hypothetical protein